MASSIILAWLFLMFIIINVFNLFNDAHLNNLININIIIVLGGSSSMSAQGSRRLLRPRTQDPGLESRARETVSRHGHQERIANVRYDTRTSTESIAGQPAQWGSIGARVGGISPLQFPEGDSSLRECLPIARSVVRCRGSARILGSWRLGSWELSQLILIRSISKTSIPRGAPASPL